jgi:SAM-dependent methyltransferase
MTTFREFEHAGWEDPATCAAYDDRLGALVAQTVEPLLDAARVSAGDRVLDVATGTGLVAAAAARRGASVVGLDFSAEQLRRARDRHPLLAVTRADAQALPVGPAGVDTVVSSYGVPHFLDPEAFFREAYRVLRASGRLAFSVWAPPRESKVYGAIFAALARHGTLDVGLPAGPDFFRFADPGTATAVLSAGGFTDVVATPVAQAWELPSIDDVLDALLRGTVRTAAVLTRQTSDVLAAVRDALHTDLRAYDEGDIVRVPMPAVVVSAVRP